MRSFAISSRPAELPWLEFELPAPPSVNRFMGKLGNRSPIVRKWVVQADMAFMCAKAWKKGDFTKIKCAYEAEFIFGRRANSDLDNRIKPLMDYLQRIQIIENDRMCERIEVNWERIGSRPGRWIAPGRVLVRLRPWMAP